MAFSTGWKLSDTVTLAKDASSTVISTTSTATESSIVIPCDAFAWCLLGIASTEGTDQSAAAASIFQVMGTYGDAEGGQTNSILFNDDLGDLKTADDAAIAFAFPDGAYPGQPASFKHYKSATFATTAAGSTTSSGTQSQCAVISRMVGFEAPQATGTANLGTSQDWDDYYLMDGSNAGCSFVAIPCGLFQFLQIKVTNKFDDENTFAAFYNLVY